MQRGIHRPICCHAGILALLCALVAPALAQDLGPAAPPLSVSLGTEAKADGRSAVVVAMSGGAPAEPDELRAHPVLPKLHCAKATVVAATKSAGPALIPIAQEKAHTLSCELRFRGQAKAFRVEVAKPAPGLYAEVSNPQPVAGDSKLNLRTFVVTKSSTSKVPRSLRASSSAGEIKLASAGQLTLALPQDDAPRALAIVLSDGVRGGAVFVPHEGKTDLPVKTPRNTGVRVRIAGTWFGPVEALDRRTLLPITVPPGVRDAVVQSIGKRGNVSETYADLKPPELARIAAVAASERVGVGESTAIYVALASPRGLAAPSTEEIRAESEQGSLSAATLEGPGLWRLDYQAGQTTGVAEIKVSVAGSPGAGEALVRVEVGAAAASDFEFDIAKKAYAPGEIVSGTVRAFDAYGNSASLSSLRLELGGRAVELESSAAGPSFRAPVPKRLSPDRKLKLVASVGKASATYLVDTIAGPPASAEIEVDVHARFAFVEIRVNDQYGNPADSKELTLVEGSGAPIDLAVDGGLARVKVHAQGHALKTDLRVMLGERELAEETIYFDPPDSALVLGAYANGAWTSNSGDLSTARAAAGVGLRRSFGAIETALLVGLEGFSSTASVEVDVGGTPESFVRKIRGIAIPIAIRGRKRVARRVGIGLGLVLLPMSTSARVAMEDSGASFKTWTTGIRAQASGDYRLGPGRLVLGASYGRVDVSEGPVIGDIEGFRLYAGYEVWPLIVHH